jgi:hypothetical protein
MHKRLVTRYAMKSAVDADENQRRVEGRLRRAGTGQAGQRELHRPAPRGRLVRARVVPRPHGRRGEPDRVDGCIRALPGWSRRAAGGRRRPADCDARRCLHQGDRLIRQGLQQPDLSQVAVVPKRLPRATWPRSGGSGGTGKRGIEWCDLALRPEPGRSPEGRRHAPARETLEPRRTAFHCRASPLQPATEARFNRL